MEGQGINATEDVTQVLLLDFFDQCVNFREVPEDLRVAVDHGKQTLGEGLIGAD